MSAQREFARDVLLPNGNPLVSGGDDGVTTSSSQEIYYSTAASAPLVITIGSVPNGFVGQPYVQLFLERGGVGSLTWSLASGSLPPGLTLSPGGILSGSPTTTGSFSFTVSVTDGSTPPKTVSANFTLTVNTLPLTFTASTVPTAVAGKPYVQALPVVGGTQPYNGTVTSGTLPPGLSLVGNLLNGTPSGTGNFAFTVTVTDSSTPTQTATQTLTMSVNTLVITTTVLPSGIVGVPYNAAINTAGGTLPLSFSLTTAAFPPGLLIQQPAPASSSGALAGTPTLAGTYFFTESVVDSSSQAQTATQNYVVTISPVGTPAPASVTLVSQPQNSVGGQTLAGSPIVVRVADSMNTAIAGVTVAMSLNGAPPCAAATLGGTLSAVTDASGNATFSNLSIDRGQFGYTLLASAGSASAVSSPFNVQGFCNSANLLTQREFHTQILLGTGKVLIAGGIDNLNNAVNTAELYDPATGTTSSTGNPPMGNLFDTNGRFGHISVLLPNGMVLLAGGSDNVTNVLFTAELYDPATGTFSSTGSMAHPRYLAEAVLLADGRVLVAGGNTSSIGTNTAEIYDPATGQWTPTGNMTQGRIRHRMTLLPNGRVLVTGGRDAPANFFGLSSAELFDPFANQGVGAFTAIGNMNSVRFVHGQSLLSNGTVLVAGGFDNTFASVTSAEIFDPATNLFTLTGNMNIARSRLSSTLIPDGSVLETGGIDSVNGFTAPAPAELYLPTAGSFALTGSMTTGRELAGATLLPNGNVLVSGGDDAVNVLQSTEVYYNTAPITPIQITATSVPNAFVGQPYVATALEQNGTGLITWSTVSGSLPPGLKGNTIGTYGTVSGTPTTAGSFTFTAQVTDGHTVATRSFTINVSVATLAFTSNTMLTGGTGRVYSQPLPVTGGTPPYTATVTSGTVPPGLTLSSNGVLSGTPSSAGSFTFTASVSDSSSPVQTATQTLTIAVNTLFITTTALPSGIVGVTYNAVISTSGGTLPLSFSAAAFPPGLTIQRPAANSQNGALAGMPTTAGHFTFYETVTDSSSPVQTATQYYTMDVFPVGTPVPATVIFPPAGQPQNSIGGQIISGLAPGSPVRVIVTDAANARVPFASVAISFNGAPRCTTAVLSGTLTAIANANGVAVFPDLSIDRGQIGYTLLASAGSASAVSQPFTVNGFCGTGTMATARELQAQVTLGNGMVLVAGGEDNSGNALSSAELYSPATGTFSATGNLTASNGRDHPANVLLPNGKVLLAGGRDNVTGSLATAELYDPSVGTFAATGSMAQARDLPTGVLLGNGKVLVSGGSNTGVILNSAEIYDSTTGLFTPTGAMNQARTGHTMTLLPNGSVLVAGGFVGNTVSGFTSLASAEIFDPSANNGVGAFTAIGNMNSARIGATATLLPNGTVLIAGGIAFTGGQTGTALSSAEILNPATRLFSPTTGSMTISRGLHSATLLPDGTVLIAGGADSFTPTAIPVGSGSTVRQTAEIYTPGNVGQFTPTGFLSTPRSGVDASLLANGNALLAGGFDAVTATAETYYSTAALAPLQVTTPTTAPARTTFFTTPALFAAAASGATTTGFNGIIPAGATFAGFNPLVVNGITFSTPLSTSGVNVNVTRASFYTPNVYPADFITNSVIPATGQPSANNTLTITLPAATRAFAMDFGGLGFRGASTATITLSNGFVLPLSSLPTAGHTQFRGFVSTTPFNTITFSTVNDDFVVEDVLVANADITLPSAVTGVPYTQMLLEHGGVGVVTWTLASGALPTGITLSPNGVLQGTPTAVGTFTFTVNVVDSSTPAKTTSATFILSVNAPAPVITGVTPTPLPAPTTAGVSFTGTFVISGQNFQGAVVTTDGPLLLTGSATVNANGTSISQGYLIGCCAPQQGQVFHLFVNTPGGSASVTDTIALTPPLAITTTTLPNGTVGTPYAFGISSSGGLQPVSFSVTSGTLPTGLTLASNGSITGTPTAAGLFTFTITATDSSSAPQTASQSYTVTIAPPVQVPATVTFVTQPQNSIEGQVLTGSAVQVLVTDATSAPIPNVPVNIGFSGTAPCAAATLGGTLTQNTDATGTASFTNLILNRGGFGYSLAATAGTITATSNVFNVEGFCDTGSLATGRLLHSSVALPNGTVLIAGGRSSFSTAALSSAELYNPINHSFASVGNMNVARAQFTLTLLPNGLVLVAGGLGGPELSSAELFDPTTNIFTLLSSSMVVARGGHVATLLSSGKVLITGGITTGGLPVASAELFDPVTNTFTATSQPMTTARYLHQASLLPNGQVLLTGGLSALPSNVLSSAELYDPIANTFSATGSMATPRYEHASSLLFTGNVLVATGFTGSPTVPITSTGTAEVYDVSTGTFSSTGSATKGPLGGFFSSVPVLPDGSIFLDTDGTNAQIYGAATGTFRVSANMSTFQAEPQTALLPDGTVLVAAGSDASGTGVPNAEVFYPQLTPGINITVTLLPNATQNQPYIQQLLEKGGVGTLTWILASGSNPLPSGITLSSGGLLSGTPTQFGGFAFTVQVTDSAVPPKTASFTYALVVLPQFQFFPLQMATALSGTPYTGNLPLVGGTLPYTSMLTAGTLPAGLTFTNGTVSGTTTALGTYTLTFQATDSSVPPRSATGTLTLPVTTPLAITTTTLPNGSLGASYSAPIATTGGFGTIVLSPTAGNFPPGLIPAIQGALSGIPTATGTFTFTLTAVDQSIPPQTASMSYTVTISTSVSPITLSPNPLNLFANNVGTMTATLSSPAGANGQVINLASSNTSVASVPANVTVPASSSSATFQVTAGPTANSATITASAPGLTSGTASVVVATRPMSLATDGPLLAINRSFNATVTLAQPAAPGGVTVTLAANPSGLVSISPASQTISAGQTTAVFSLTAGSSAGGVLLTASASGFTNATAPLTVTTAVISLQTGVTVAPGQSVSMALSLSQPAPVGGLTVNLTSSAPANATITPSVFIPGGAQTPSANPQITGVLIGSTNVTATAIGFGPDSAPVSVTVTATLSPNTVTVIASGGTKTVTLTISAPAPAGGIAFTLLTDSPSTATAPAQATVIQGATSVQFLVTGVTAATTTLRADSPGITEATATVNVTPAPPISLGSLTIGQNLQSLTNIFLGAAAPLGGITVTVTSADQTKVLLSQTGKDAGNVTQQYTVGAGNSFVGTLFVYALQGSGTVQVTATAPGYAAGSGTMTLDPSGFIINSPGAINTTTFSGPTQVQVTPAALSPGTLNWAGNQPLRPGIGPFSVPVSLAISSVGALTPSTLTFNGGDSFQNTSFQPSTTAGNTTLNLGAQPAGFSTPSNFQQISVAVSLPTISLGNLQIGNNLHSATNVFLAVTPPSAVSVTLTTDPTKALLSLTGTDAGSSTVTFNNVTSSFVGTLHVYAVQGTGTAQISANAPGYATGTSTITLQPSGFIINSPGAINTTTFSGPTQVQVTPAVLAPGTLNWAGNQPLRPGIGPFNISILITGGIPGTLTPTTLTFNGGDSFQNTSFQPSNAGNANVTLGAQPAGFSASSNFQQIPVAVTAPSISLGNLTIGNNLQSLTNVFLGARPPSPVTVTLTTDPTKALLSLTGTDAGSSTVSFTNVSSTFVGTLHVYAVQGTGTAQISANAPGYATGTSTITLQPSGFIINSPGAINTTTFSGPTQVQVTSALLTPGTLTWAGNQPLRPGIGPFNISLALTGATPGTLMPTTLTFNGGDSFQNSSFQPSNAGSATINLGAQPAGFSTSANFQQIPVAVTAPAINVASNVSVGLNLQVSVNVFLQSVPPNPVTLTITSPNSSIATVTTNPAVAGGATATFTNVTSTFVGTLTIQGISQNTTQLKLQAPGYSDAFVNVTVNPSGFIINTPSNFTASVGSNRLIQITPAMLDPSTLNFAGNQTLRAGFAVNVSVNSSDATVGTISTSPVAFTGNSTFVNTTFQALKAGSTFISVVPPTGFSLPGNFQQILATVQ
ncbi:MAG TPA: kelch repeat-containing protein [Candidatus Acidoferrum sp.]|nr:kelch repeat-containing protein [Candidatus Acidoferrum sp.]